MHSRWDLTLYHVIHAQTGAFVYAKTKQPSTYLSSYQASTRVFIYQHQHGILIVMEVVLLALLQHDTQLGIGDLRNSKLYLSLKSYSISKSNSLISHCESTPAS